MTSLIDSPFTSNHRHCIVLILFSILFKILLIPVYHSTDFEVHRNWLAITHSLPVKEWYYEKTSEWTLDYPPFFAYFEYLLSLPAYYVDKNMLQVQNLNYKSPATINYQRFTVIFTEFVLVYALIKFLNQLDNKKRTDTVSGNFLSCDSYMTVQIILNFSLIMIDNIHFQYNGFMFGIMMLSIYYIQNEKWVIGSFLFSSLINFKHIYLYIAPAFFFYILFFYCLRPGSALAQLGRLIKIGIIAIIPFVLSLGPFIYMNQIPQLISRLFPFKRGLCHAYWAPNVWAIYNFVDKVLSIVLKRKSTGSSTSGLVQDIEHVVLPSVPPIITFILSFIFILGPSLFYVYKVTTGNKANKKSAANPDSLIILTIICGYGSFLFGWHVHEKAVLLILIPLSYISFKNQDFAKLYFLMSLISNYSLFPLIFRKQEYPIKLLCFILFTFYNYSSLKFQFKGAFKMDIPCRLALYGLIFLETYNVSIHYILSIDSKLPYLPLMLTSIYCAVFVLFCWFKFLYLILINK